MYAPLGCILLMVFKIINDLIFQKILGWNWHICKVIIIVKSANAPMPVPEPNPNVNSKGRFKKHNCITSLSRKPFFDYHSNRMVQYHLLHLQGKVKYIKQINNPIMITSVRLLKGPGVLWSWVVNINKHLWEVEIWILGISPVCASTEGLLVHRQ